MTQIYSLYIRLLICLHLAETLVSDESPVLDMSADLRLSGNVVDGAARYNIFNPFVSFWTQCKKINIVR